MIFDKIQFFLFTALTGFIIGFLTTYLGIKISKMLLIIGVIIIIIFYVFVNGNFELNWDSIYQAITSQKDWFSSSVSSIRNILMRNIPLTIGVIFGVIYGFKKA